MKHVAVGIDLGTTNSLIAVSFSGKVNIIEVEGKKLLPSVVYYSNSEEVFVGNSAKVFSSAIRSVKRLIGKSYIDISKNIVASHFNIGSKEGQINIITEKKSVSPEEVSAEILKALKKAAENFLKTDVNNAVITVPAYFDDAARNATRKAAKIAGLEVIRLINEPTAAAVAYGIQNKATGTFAVYDLGGGTFDISILRIQDGVLKVIAVAGDLQLGGDDFDIELLNFIIKKYNLNVPNNNVSLALNEAKRIKEHLTYHKKWLGTDKDYFHGCSITLSEFEKATEHLLKRTISLFKKALKDANYSADGSDGNVLDAIILVGGSTKMSCIKLELEKEFCVNIQDSFNPDEIVVIGAAIQAEVLYNSLDSNLLLDVTPLSLGIEVIGGIVEVIIPRNTPIPVEVKKMFTTSQDNQTIFQLHILQGESEIVSSCRSLAKFELSKIPKMPAGIPRLLITFRIDTDGILVVFAEEINTGIKQSIEIKPSYGLSDKTLKFLLTNNK